MLSFHHYGNFIADNYLIHASTSPKEYYDVLNAGSVPFGAINEDFTTTIGAFDDDVAAIMPPKHACETAVKNLADKIDRQCVCEDDGIIKFDYDKCIQILVEKFLNEHELLAVEHENAESEESFMDFINSENEE